MMEELPRERLGIAAQAIGAAEGALDLTVAYVKERKAFGQSIGAFQNTRFKLADVKTEIGLNRALYEQCADEYARDELTADKAAMLKLASCEMQCSTIDDCLQLVRRLRVHRRVPDLTLLHRRAHPAHLRRLVGDHARAGRTHDAGALGSVQPEQ
jgi:alkylation response protein AidB-like acyl-CoA dehydrogenase